MKRAELIGLLPKNKDDVEAARILVRLGFPAVQSVLRDMLLWLRVDHAPVADIFSAFFAELTPPPIELIAKHLGTRSETLRKRILVEILPAWSPEAVRLLSSDLKTLATRPDSLNNDVECLRLILKHDLAEKQWVGQWLAFRKEQAANRLRFFEELERLARSDIHP